MTSQHSLFPEAMHELLGWRNFYKDGTIVVCGLGPSIKEFAPYARYFTTIGVNDIGRHFDPDYLLVVDPKHQFDKSRGERTERHRHIAETKAMAVFSQLGTKSLGFEPDFLVKMQVTRMGTPKIDDPVVLPCTNNTPYIATALAAFMGAKRIGLVGVDFIGHTFEGSASQISIEFGKLNGVIKAVGGEIFNLSQVSLIKTLRRGSLEDLMPKALVESMRKRTERKQ